MAEERVPLYRLGFFEADYDAAAAYLRVSRRHLQKLRYGDDTPTPEQQEALEGMGRGWAFPLDIDALPVHVVGRLAWRAFDALRCGDAEAAESFSGRGLGGGIKSWETGETLTNNQLQWFACQVANGMAWARNSNCPRSPDGVPALRLLRRDILDFVRGHPDIVNDTNTRRTWQCLIGLCSGYTLGFLVGELEDKRAQSGSAASDDMVAIGRAITLKRLAARLATTALA